MFRVILLTLFPEMFPGTLGFSLAGKAFKNKIWSYETINIRDFGITKHQNVDSTACGGGNGLILRPDVLGNALDRALEIVPNSEIYYLSPRGKTFDQSLAKQLSKKKDIIILCGRFEGIDERVIQEYNVTQISLGDYILSGGEPGALALLDSVIRLLPGVLSNEETLKEESFETEKDGMKLIEHPLYTKPIQWREKKVPEVLLSGNHKLIKEWKISQSLEITRSKNKSSDNRRK
ncbi:MAG TPA: tRNA (guanosine(37)-N1)-methyltransferase TrmD [Candidatus Megaira endosymbiont of Nemacystus decipiens]|nr:tRNA (guanosine(37)-N1)-methyltransferase TrmD [Candidatus Megaera endosymbiont of Nemacystus decipiens]